MLAAECVPMKILIFMVVSYFNLRRKKQLRLNLDKAVLLTLLLSVVYVVMQHPYRIDQDGFSHLGQQLLVQLGAVKVDL